jgi:hypothetical protein
VHARHRQALIPLTVAVFTVKPNRAVAVVRIQNTVTATGAAIAARARRALVNVDGAANATQARLTEEVTIVDQVGAIVAAVG